MLRSFIRPLSAKRVLQSGRNSAVRFQSTKKNDKTVDFRTFISVSIIASIILTQVVDAVNQEQPRGQKGMSESEYYKMQQRLKRKTTLFTPDQKQVLLWKDATDNDVNNINELHEKGVEVVDPLKLVAVEKENKESRYYDLLNDPEMKELPRGLAVELIGKALKNSEKTKFIVIGFPKDVKEAIQFEEKIVTIKNLAISQDDSQNDDVFRYYKTVNKSVIADKDIASLLE